LAVPPIPAGQPTKATPTRVLKPEDWVKRQIDTLKDVGEKNFRVGIAFPKADPIKAGIDAEAVYAAEVKKAIDERRRAARLEKTNIDEWYAYTQGFAGRLVEGVTTREKEVHDFVKPFQPMLLAHLAEVDKLPKVTLRERIDKAVKNIEGLAALRGKW